jgi:hypothetical protein
MFLSTWLSCAAGVTVMPGASNVPTQVAVIRLLLYALHQQQHNQIDDGAKAFIQTAVPVSEAACCLRSLILLTALAQHTATES